MRIAVTAVVLALVTATTFWGADDFFPFAPFKMYSFSKELDGWAGSTRVEAVNEEGERFSLRESTTGFRRAELEGQKSRFIEDPSLLEYIAEAYENTNPDKPEIVTVEIIERRYELEDGYQTGEVIEVVEASWTREGTDA
ncbi:hypothetical protein SAMN05216270_10650 [Glycomyces harbinensis]|uniref:Uncharacterized protein n=1 Tax=Glycomyces harbinensis TaxID=58114 RepID=A0A1G6WK21_9ACTN|nr:hypothetical protein SAMN05216270_10650 [Glycomyces harbinensis]